MKKENTVKLYNPDFVLEIKQIVAQARQKAYAAINSAMVDAYWQMGKRIVEQEQFGKERADYGAQLLKSLSKELTAELLCKPLHNNSYANKFIMQSDLN